MIVLAVPMCLLTFVTVACDGGNSPGAAATPVAEAFQVTIRLTYFHNGPGDSTLFGCLATDPAQASARYSYTVTQQDGTTVPGSGTLDQGGKATISVAINQFSTYRAEVSVSKGGQTRTANATEVVGPQQGSRCT